MGVNQTRRARLSRKVCNTVAVKEDLVTSVSCVKGCTVAILRSATSAVIAVFSHKYFRKAGHGGGSSGEVLAVAVRQ